jgi:hypothetical protein
VKAKALEPEMLIRQAEAIEAAAQEAVREALEMHKRAGNPVVVEEHGQLRWIPAQELLDTFQSQESAAHPSESPAG